MMGATDSSATIKAGVRGAYDLAAPRYRQLIMPTFVPIARRVLALARPNTDDVHLDLATGAGLIPAVADDRRWLTCIPPWRVGMDFSRSMLGAARIASPPTKLVQGDLDHLPFRNDSIDLVTLSLALHHLPTPRHAIREIRRIVRPRGRVVLAAWADELGPLCHAFDRWFERAGLGRISSGQPEDLKIDTPDRLRSALLDVAGFGTVEVSRELPEIRFPSLDDFWEWRISFPATYEAIMAVAPARRERLRADCLATLRPLVAGEVRADQAVLFALARP